MKGVRLPHSFTLISILCLGLLFPSSASAHSFGQQYTLPVPVWMYLYGAAAALVVSFVVVGYFVNSRSIQANLREYDLAKIWAPGRKTSRFLIGILRGSTVGALVLSILTGLLGTQDSYRNINMTLFWVIFGLGFTYLTALIGDWFAVVNPFRVLVDWMEGVLPVHFRGRYRYPEALEYWPALVFYVAFIWMELFGRTTPFSLSAALLAYVLVNSLGCWFVGKSVWFQRCEFLGVFLRLVAKMAPMRCETGDSGVVTGVYVRQPFVGLFQEKKIPVSLLVFVLFMLSSTAFDGLEETALWVRSFWNNIYQWVLIPVYGNAPNVTYPTIEKLFLAYQTVALILSPLVYFAVYALFMYFASAVTRHVVPTKQLSLSFGLTLIPIAFAYHLTHYYTLLQIQGAQIVRLISDPFGIGWDLFGTARQVINIVPDLGVVWHTQVFTIVLGHVISVYLAHMQAMRVFPDHRAAVLSQLPTLTLMIGLTTLGLWILSLPLGAGVLRG